MAAPRNLQIHIKDIRDNPQNYRAHFALGQAYDAHQKAFSTTHDHDLKMLKAYYNALKEILKSTTADLQEKQKYIFTFANRCQITTGILKRHENLVTLIGSENYSRQFKKDFGSSPQELRSWLLDVQSELETLNMPETDRQCFKAFQDLIRCVEMFIKIPRHDKSQSHPASTPLTPVC